MINSVIETQEKMRKHYLQIFILGLILLLSSQNSEAQLSYTRSEIIKEKGNDYESGATDDGRKSIMYNEHFNSEKSGNFTRFSFFFFKTLANGKEICNLIRIIDPSSETNSNVGYFKKNLIEIDYMKWKDYESNVIYQIELVDGLCMTSIYYDIKN